MSTVLGNMQEDRSSILIMCREFAPRQMYSPDNAYDILLLLLLLGQSIFAVSYGGNPVSIIKNSSMISLIM